MGVLSTLVPHAAASYLGDTYAALVATPNSQEQADTYAALATWLQSTEGWGPLHHIEQLTTDRTRALLRGGASLHAGSPSPLERARAVGGEVSALLLRAARWSEGSHDLFPAPTRAQAVEVMRLGYLLASALGSTALVDLWRQFVLPHAITRA
jgi:hypothetical protein